MVGHLPLEPTEFAPTESLNRLEDANDTGSSQNLANAPACSTWMCGGSDPSLEKKKNRVDPIRRTVCIPDQRSRTHGDTPSPTELGAHLPAGWPPPSRRAPALLEDLDVTRRDTLRRPTIGRPPAPLRLAAGPPIAGTPDQPPWTLPSSSIPPPSTRITGGPSVSRMLARRVPPPNPAASPADRNAPSWRGPSASQSDGRGTRHRTRYTEPSNAAAKTRRRTRHRALAAARSVPFGAPVSTERNCANGARTRQVSGGSAGSAPRRSPPHPTTRQ